MLSLCSRYHYRITLLLLPLLLSACIKSPDVIKTEIGNDVSIGHNAIVHGCKIENSVLIGMGSIVMDNSIIESNSIVAAGSVVLENTHIKAGSIFAGVPAKKIKNVSNQVKKNEIERIASSYLKYSNWYKNPIK